jgi:dTDP-4-amino-4,6-dideoxygalactose transaminase
MAIPFFSIDFQANDFIGLLNGMFSLRREKSLDKLSGIIKSEFPEHEVILFPSARMAFFLILETLFQKGDEIIFPVLGFPLYVKIAVQLGLNPKLVDVEPNHFTINPDEIEKAISNNTKGIVVTHLFGHPAELNKIRIIADKHNLLVIEDCAQSYDSSYKGRLTGTTGTVGIFSSSLMKVPTTLGGGVVVTRDRKLAQQLQKVIENSSFWEKVSVYFSLFAKNMISILNSFPLLYTLFSHYVFGIIKKRNPALLRKILYSGMGLSGGEFNVWERPPLAGYQLEVGAIQFSRTRKMAIKRRKYSKILNDAVAGIPGVKVLEESSDVFWNYQYHVIQVECGMEKLFDQMFNRGFHLMKENVWDCTRFDFNLEEQEFTVGSAANKGLIRIPNSSFLSTKQINEIALNLKECCGILAQSD